MNGQSQAAAIQFAMHFRFLNFLYRDLEYLTRCPSPCLSSIFGLKIGREHEVHAVPSRSGFVRSFPSSNPQDARIHAAIARLTLSSSKRPLCERGHRPIRPPPAPDSGFDRAISPTQAHVAPFRFSPGYASVVWLQIDSFHSTSSFHRPIAGMHVTVSPLMGFGLYGPVPSFHLQSASASMLTSMCTPAEFWPNLKPQWPVTRAVISTLSPS